MTDTETKEKQMAHLNQLSKIIKYLPIKNRFPEKILAVAQKNVFVNIGGIQTRQNKSDGLYLK